MRICARFFSHTSTQQLCKFSQSFKKVELTSQQSLIIGVFWRLYRFSSFLFEQRKGHRGYTGSVDKTLAAMWRIGTNKSEKLKLERRIKNFFFFFLHCPLFREGCGGSSSRLSRHTSRSSITSIISLGRSPKQFHPRSSM